MFKKKETHIQHYVISNEKGHHYGRVHLTIPTLFGLFKKDIIKWVCLNHTHKNNIQPTLVDDAKDATLFYGKEQCRIYMSMAVNNYLVALNMIYAKRVKS